MVDELSLQLKMIDQLQHGEIVVIDEAVDQQTHDIYQYIQHNKHLPHSKMMDQL